MIDIPGRVVEMSAPARESEAKKTAAKQLDPEASEKAAKVPDYAQ